MVRSSTTRPRSTYDASAATSRSVRRRAGRVERGEVVESPSARPARGRRRSCGACAAPAASPARPAAGRSGSRRPGPRPGSAPRARRRSRPPPPRPRRRPRRGSRPGARRAPRCGPGVPPGPGWSRWVGPGAAVGGDDGGRRGACLEPAPAATTSHPLIHRPGVAWPRGRSGPRRTAGGHRRRRGGLPRRLGAAARGPRRCRRRGPRDRADARAPTRLHRRQAHPSGRPPGRPGRRPVLDVDRGGTITFHGPGQLVGYPIVRLPQHVFVVDYVRRVEEALIGVCRELGSRPRASRAAAASGCAPTSPAAAPAPSARSPPSASGSPRASPCTASR